MAEDKWMQAFAMVYSAACPEREVAVDDPLGMAKEAVTQINWCRSIVSRLKEAERSSCEARRNFSALRDAVPPMGQHAAMVRWDRDIKAVHQQFSDATRIKAAIANEAAQESPHA